MTQYSWENFIADIRDKIVPNEILLDAGAGDCRFKEYFPSAKYIGMDLGVAANELNYSKLDIKGDLRNIPLENSSVSTIISIQVIEHLPEPWKVVKEFNRVLQKDGYLFISCPQGVPQHQVPYDFFRYTPFGLRSLLESNGFEVIWIKPQFGNFNHIYNELHHSLTKLPKLTEKTLAKFIFRMISLYVRLLFKIHKPLLLYFDNFKELQDSPVGHFLMARKL